MSEEPKKAGRPKGDPRKKSIKPNISIRRDLLAELDDAASRRGIGRSDYVAMAIMKQMARDDAKQEHEGAHASAAPLRSVPRSAKTPQPKLA